MGGVIGGSTAPAAECIGAGNLPIIGALFRRRTEQDIPRYLLIFVTATIVKETGEFLVYDESGTTNSVAPSK
jgi:type IV pilus assembly protein PilQ